jgi:hypothetical protein
MSHGASSFLGGRKLVSNSITWCLVCRNLFLLLLLLAAALFGGCRTTPCQEHPEDYSRAFDPKKVARLSHEAYQVAWHARFWARRDLKVSPVWATADDGEALYFLKRIYQQAPWVARDIEKHPATPRCSSKDSYDSLRFNATMFRRYYRPASYQGSTDSMVQDLIRILDEINSYYEAPPAKPKTT